MRNEAEFDKFADEYHQQHTANISITGESPAYFSEYKIRELRCLVTERNSSSSEIFDFGSGVGNSIEFFRKHFSESRLTCGDISTRSIEISKTRFPDAADYLHIENDTIPCDDSSFDVVFSACVFHHIPEQDHARWLEEIWRITRPGGMLMIFEHNPFNPLTVRAVNTCPFDENAQLIAAAKFKRSMSAMWRNVEIRYHVFFPRALSALRPLETLMKWLPLGAQYSIHARKC